MLELNKIYNMDCMEGMKLLDDNSIDSIVTDPPYELGFMGLKWDNMGIAYNIELWKECLRILKPGGHLLAFGGTRTYHRMTCAIEDAGFEIRDCIQWLYGSGFPKSHDISKAIDKKLGTYVEGKLLPSSRTTGASATGIATTFRKKTASNPQAPEAQQWDGWGTALKPANEPIVLARKPLSEKTIAENVLKWGTGGLNIDGCRIGENAGWCYPHGRGGKGWGGRESLSRNLTDPISANKGRFPANVILDEEAGKLLDEQSGISKGGASRFFYCAKASKKERGEGNNHPTVKPVSLIKYLVTLVTPPDGVCLDPFIGSGTTAVACINTNRNYIGFEIDPDYYEAALERVRIHMQQRFIREWRG
jgi:site-specific DNA-methyltransferase (adenine-specific)